MIFPFLPSPPDSEAVNSQPASLVGSFRWGMLLLLGFLLVSCATPPPPQNVVVSVPDQWMGFFHENQLVADFPISTSKFGLGEEPGSYRTPVCTREVAEKIGGGAPLGAVFKSRRQTGEVLQPNAPGRDPIVTRIFWLKGKDSGTKNAYTRYIYIHGTPEERTLGHSTSYGCVRMASRDIAYLYEHLPVRAEVTVTMERLHEVVQEREAKQAKAKGSAEVSG